MPTERPVSGAATLPPPPSFPSPSAISFAERASALLWEDWLRHAPQTQQAEMLELAQRQGFLFVHQLPRPADGAAAPVTPPESDRVALLQRLLGGVGGVGGVGERLAPAPDVDGSLDELSLAPLQRLAVWRGWRTPDVALFRAKPGSAAAILAEIAVQAARQGQRVLLAAFSTAPLDATLAKLQCPSPVLPVRLLGPGESTAALAPAIRALTLDEQRQAFQAKTMQQAEQALTAAEDCCRCRQAEEPLWPELHRVAVAHAELDGRLRTLQARRANVPGEVESEANGVPHSGQPPSDPFASQVAEHRQAQTARTGDLERAQARLREEQADGCVALAEAETAWAALEPLAVARTAGRWWTLAWWKARFAADLPERVTELDARRRGLRAEQERRAAELATLARKRADLEARFGAERQALVGAEVQRRRAEWDAQIEAVEAQLEPLQRQWSDLVGRFRPPTLAPEAVGPAAVAAAQARWQEHRQQDEAAGLFARQWATFLHDAAPRFLKQLPRYASLIAGTHAALRANAEALEGGFDLVIVDEADRMLENDLLRLARNGQRWLLVGELPAAAGRATTFAKLWQALHVRPNPQPYVFRREGERLCCQLRPVSSRDRQSIESERLADFPEIELRILTLPRSQPQLVQVVFPPSMTVAQAKAFVYRELQEVALHAKGRNVWLEETASAWRLHLDPAATASECADLDAGLCEHLTADGATCRLDFAKAHWQRGQVDEWIERYLRCRDLGRTVDLP